MFIPIQVPNELESHIQSALISYSFEVMKNKRKSEDLKQNADILPEVIFLWSSLDNDVLLPLTQSYTLLQKPTKKMKVDDEDEKISDIGSNKQTSDVSDTDKLMPADNNDDFSLNKAEKAEELPGPSNPEVFVMCYFSCDLLLWICIQLWELTLFKAFVFLFSGYTCFWGHLLLSISSTKEHEWGKALLHVRLFFL